MSYVLLEEAPKLSGLAYKLSVAVGVIVGLMIVVSMEARPPPNASPPPIPSPPASKPAPSASLRLKANSNGNFLTEATINGHKTNCLADTGASRVTIPKSFARVLGLSNLDFSVLTTTANGDVRSAAVTLTEVTAGGVTLRNVDALVGGGKLFGCLLGQTWLNKFHVEMSDGIMTIEDRRS